MPNQSTKVIRTCFHCGRDYLVHAYRADAPKRNFCSTQCHLAQKSADGSYFGPERYEVDPVTGCWNWRGPFFNHTYGQMRVDGKMVGAHRISYERLVGPIPDGLEIDHLCRNPKCVNPQHLEPVSHRENAIRGSNRKVTDEMVRFIRSADGTMPRIKIARTLGVSYRTVWEVLTDRKWADVA